MQHPGRDLRHRQLPYSIASIFGSHCSISQKICALRIQAVESYDVPCRHVIVLSYDLTGVAGLDRVIAARSTGSALSRSVAITHDGKGTHAERRGTLLPAAGTPIQTDVKSEKVVTIITDVRLKLGGVR